MTSPIYLKNGFLSRLQVKKLGKNQDKKSLKERRSMIPDKFLFRTFYPHSHVEIDWEFKAFSLVFSAF